MPEFEYTPFVKFIPSLITLPSHPLAGKHNITAQQIAAYNLTMCPPNYFAIPGLNTFFKRHGIQPTFKVEFFDWEAPRRYIEAVIGISIANNIMLEANDVIVATPLLHYFPINDYGYVTIRGHNAIPKLKCITYILKNLYPNGVCENGITIPLDPSQQSTQK